MPGATNDPHGKKAATIVVPRCPRRKRPIFFKTKTTSIVFVIPYEDNFLRLATTDVEYEGNPERCQNFRRKTNHLFAENCELAL